MQVHIGNSTVEFLGMGEGTNKIFLKGGHTYLVSKIFELECITQMPFKNVVIVGEKQTSLHSNLEDDGVPSALV